MQANNISAFHIHHETLMNPTTQHTLKKSPPPRIGWSYDNYFREQQGKIKQKSNNDKKR